MLAVPMSDDQKQSGSYNMHGLDFVVRNFHANPKCHVSECIYMNNYLNGHVSYGFSLRPTILSITRVLALKVSLATQSHNYSEDVWNITRFIFPELDDILGDTQWDIAGRCLK